MAIIVACKETKEVKIDYKEAAITNTLNETPKYPENLGKVFQAHGGLNTWNKMQNLVFTIARPNGDEVTTTHLKNRNSHIEMPNHVLGYNGEDVWLKHKDTVAYKGKPRFYYNLMFYFYAMPFILADDGIIYEDAEALTFEGKTYPGIKISYNAGVGESPEDEYILYYDSDTFKMTWLAYTVTFFTKEKSREFRYIQYSKWKETEGLLLPETLAWYNVEEHKPTTKRNELNFKDIYLSEEGPNAALFKKTKDAEVVD